MASQDEEDAIFQHLRESGYSENEAAMAAAEAVGASNAGIPGSDLQMRPGETAVKALVPMLGAGLGGVGARVVAGKLIPEAAQAVGPLISGAGQFLGTFAGNKAIGMPTGQAVQNASMAGGAGTAIEGLGNIMTRAGGWVGSVPRATVNETLSSPARAWELARPFAQQAPDAEFNLAKDMRARLQTKEPPPGVASLGKKTTARVRAEGALRRFDNANPAKPTAAEAAIGEPASSTGAIDTGQIRSRILGMIKPNSLEEGQQTVNDYLRRKASALPDKMSAADLDTFILEHKKPIQQTFGQEQVSLPQGVKRNIVGAAIATRNQAVPEARADFAKASAQLGSMRAMANKLLTRTGEVRPTAESTFKNILKNQQTREMFSTYEKQTGNDGVLLDADNLAMKRQWSREDFGHAGYLWYLAERVFGRPAGKVAAILAQPAGHTAAATTAFMAAMQPTQMERNIEQAKRPNP